LVLPNRAAFAARFVFAAEADERAARDGCEGLKAVEII
jgi:hypothetical protein